MALVGMGELFAPSYYCSDYTNPIARWLGNCPDVNISPAYVTPAAPRSIAEMTSGLWSPAEAMRLTLEKYTAEKLRQQELSRAANWQMPSSPSDNPTELPIKTGEWIFMAGAVVASLIVVKAVLK